MSYLAGNKVNNIDVVYTPWQNLKKTPSMDVGQVGFHNNKSVSSLLLLEYIYIYYIYIKLLVCFLSCICILEFSRERYSHRWLFVFGFVFQVRTVRVEKRINEVVNRLNRTKVERKPDLKGT